MGEFQQPGRGAGEAYDRYLRGMDAALKQKVALTAAHLLCDGKVVDMGMGSGSGSEALAALYPRLAVVGVDVDPEMVERARQRYRLPNLSFATGDAAELVFAEGSLDGIFDSSMLHHVTSYGGYRLERASQALEVQARQLAPHGVLIVRDFMAPPAGGEVILELPTADGDQGDDPASCSSAALLRLFSRQFRSLSSSPGFTLRELEACADGWARFALARQHAVEFLLRKDYRTDWKLEAQEEYCTFDQATFEALYTRLGLRILASTPIVNPWIVRHRLEGKYRWRQGDAPLPHPATNILVVGEKVPPGEGVRFSLAPADERPGYLEATRHRRRDGSIRELARRPHPTIDVVPWFSEDGDLYVLARMSYPRPILAAWPADDAPLDGRRPPQFVTEPLALVQQGEPLGSTVEAFLAEHAGIPPADLVALWPGTTYYPSPGGVQEEVRSTLVEIRPRHANRTPASRSGFVATGRLGAIAAEQVLRAAQVGGLPDARLELNVYELLLSRGLGAGEWIGDRLEVGQASERTSLAELARAPRREYLPAPAEETRYLTISAARFEERGVAGELLASRTLEWMAPRQAGLNTVATALLAEVGGQLCLGLDDDDLPAAQCFAGNSSILVAPAFRLPRGVRELDAAAFVAERLHRDYGVTTAAPVPLGGPYFPTPGLTPEIVYPWALAVRSTGAGQRPLHFVPLAELVAARGHLPDGHLRVVLLRAAHALGLFSAARSG